MVFLLALCASFPLFSQSNRIVDALLAEEHATLGNTAYLVLFAAGKIAEDASPSDSVETLSSFDWGFEKAREDDVVDFGSLALMIMECFEMRGGIMYSIFSNRRYAAREFVFLDFSRSFVSRYHIVSGDDVVNILGRSLEYLETKQ